MLRRGRRLLAFSALEQQSIDPGQARIAASLLGLPPNFAELPGQFSQKRIRKAYFRTSRRAHPDMGGTEAHFMKIQAAYKLLSGGAAGMELTAESRRDAQLGAWPAVRDRRRAGTPASTEVQANLRLWTEDLQARASKTGIHFPKRIGVKDGLLDLSKVGLGEISTENWLKAAADLPSEVQAECLEMLDISGNKHLGVTGLTAIADWLLPSHAILWHIDACGLDGQDWHIGLAHLAEGLRQRKAPALILTGHEATSPFDLVKIRKELRTLGGGGVGDDGGWVFVEMGTLLDEKSVLRYGPSPSEVSRAVIVSEWEGWTRQARERGVRPVADGSVGDADSSSAPAAWADPRSALFACRRWAAELSAGADIIGVVAALRWLACPDGIAAAPGDGPVAIAIPSEALRCRKPNGVEPPAPALQFVAEAVADAAAALKGEAQRRLIVRPPQRPAPGAGAAGSPSFSIFEAAPPQSAADVAASASDVARVVSKLGARDLPCDVVCAPPVAEEAAALLASIRGMPPYLLMDGGTLRVIPERAGPDHVPPRMVDNLADARPFSHSYLYLPDDTDMGEFDKIAKMGQALNARSGSFRDWRMDYTAGMPQRAWESDKEYADRVLAGKSAKTQNFGEYWKARKRETIPEWFDEDGNNPGQPEPKKKKTPEKKTQARLQAWSLGRAETEDLFDRGKKVGYARRVAAEENKLNQYRAATGKKLKRRKKRVPWTTDGESKETRAWADEKHPRANRGVTPKTNRPAGGDFKVKWRGYEVFSSYFSG